MESEKYSLEEIMSDVRLIIRGGFPVFVPYVFLTDEEKKEFCDDCNKEV